MKKVNLRKKVILTVLIAILCGSIVLTAIPTVKADEGSPTIDGPRNINWQAFINNGLGAYLHVAADKLYNGAPYAFHLEAPVSQYYPYCNYRLLFIVDWGDGSGQQEFDSENNQNFVDISHTWNTANNWYEINVTAVYDYYGYGQSGPYYASPTYVYVNDKPVLDPAGGQTIYGPFDPYTHQPRDPNTLVAAQLYSTRIHAYHIAFDSSAFWDSAWYNGAQHSGLNSGWGVIYRFNWGDNSQHDYIMKFDGDQNEETPTHMWNVGDYTITAWAGWYPLVEGQDTPSEQTIIWSTSNTLNVHVGENNNFPPQPPTQELININLKDPNDNAISNGAIYVDGTNVGASWSGYLTTYAFTAQPHQISFECNDGVNTVFQGYTITNAGSGTENPMYLYVDAPATVTAVFGPPAAPTPTPSPPTTYQLSMSGYDQYAVPIGAPIYIDSQFYGYTGQTLTVPVGNHEFYVDSSVNDGMDHYFWYFSTPNGYYYSNDMYFASSLDTWMQVLYWTNY